MKKVLVAEDEESIREFIVINLTRGVIPLSKLITALPLFKNSVRMSRALMSQFLTL